MDYNTVTEDIIRLTDDLNTWSSTLCIPVKDSEALLDISSAANGANSCVPPEAKNQPITFPKSKGLRSVYRFDTEVFFGESSWGEPTFHVEDCGQWMQYISSQDYATKVF
jgi:hypothetical protein